ncbi:MAG: Rossmann-like domain-containing protein, partial [Candidatus Odinarchaeota archaeon]
HIYRYHKLLPPKVTRVVVGLGYTGVELAAYAYEPFLGVAQTLPNVIHNTDCSKTNFAGKLTKLPYTELITWSLEPLSLEKTIGIATLNAASQHVLAVKNPYVELKEGLIDYLKINEKTRINFIGFIGPMIKKISVITKNITIVDDNPIIKTLSNEFNIKSNINQLNEQELNVDILFCSGTSILNGTLEDIISIFKKNAGYIVVIGPTISFIPDILFDYGVDIVGGMKILDSEATLRVLQEGGGTRLFKKYGKKYNFIKS